MHIPLSSNYPFIHRILDHLSRNCERKQAFHGLQLKNRQKKCYKTFDLNDKAAKINILLAKFMKYADQTPRIEMGRIIY